MNLLLTGASGFIGKNVLMRGPADWRIGALFSGDERFPAFVAGLPRSNITAVRCDLRDEAQIAALATEHGVDWDCCLYLAARVDIPWSVREPKADLLANTVPLIDLLDQGVPSDSSISLQVPFTMVSRGGGPLQRHLRRRCHMPFPSSQASTTSSSSGSDDVRSEII